MTSRYQSLRVFGTLAVIIAWVILIVGLLAAFGSWRAAQSVAAALEVSNTQMTWLAALPGILVAILGFIEFYAIGKVLHLLVDVDGATQDVQRKLSAPIVAESAPGAGAEISGELKRQAKLIASNLEATQALQKQISSLSTRLAAQAALPTPATVIAPVAHPLSATPMLDEHIVAEVIEEASA